MTERVILTVANRGVPPLSDFILLFDSQIPAKLTHQVLDRVSQCLQLISTFQLLSRICSETEKSVENTDPTGTRQKNTKTCPSSCSTSRESRTAERRAA